MIVLIIKYNGDHVLIRNHTMKAPMQIVHELISREVRDICYYSKFVTFIFDCTRKVSVNYTY